MTRRATAQGAGRPLRSTCPVACSLDLIGDRWTLVVVRDLFMGKHRFSDFMASEEGITTNILAERLTRLERAGLVERASYQAHPPRYEYHLTSAGRDLSPVLQAILKWGRAHIPGLAAPVAPAKPTGRSVARQVRPRAS